MVDIAGNILAQQGLIPRYSNLLANREALRGMRTENALGRQSLRLNDQALVLDQDANRRANALLNIQQQQAARQQSVFETEEGQSKARQIYEGALIARENPAAIPSFIQSLKDMGEIDPSFSGNIDEHALEIIINGIQTKLGQSSLAMSQLANPDLPSDIRSSLYFRGLTPDQQAEELARRRALQTVDTGAGIEVVDPVGRSTAGLVSPSASAEAIAERESSQAAQVASSEAGARNLQNALNDQIAEGFAAADAIPIMRRGIELLQEGVRTGGFNNLALWASNRLGITGADEGELSANLGKAVLSQLRATFGAQFTEREGARLQEIEAGFGKSSEVNMRLLQQAQAIAERSARRGITAARRAGRAEDATLIEQAMNASFDYSDHAQQQTNQGVPAQIMNDAEFNALPSGALFVGPDGILRQKP